MRKMWIENIRVEKVPGFYLTTITGTMQFACSKAKIKHQLVHTWNGDDAKPVTKCTLSKLNKYGQWSELEQYYCSLTIDNRLDFSYEQFLDDFTPEKQAQELALYDLDGVLEIAYPFDDIEKIWEKSAVCIAKATGNREPTFVKKQESDDEEHGDVKVLKIIYPHFFVKLLMMSKDVGNGTSPYYCASLMHCDKFEIAEGKYKGPWLDKTLEDIRKEINVAYESGDISSLPESEPNKTVPLFSKLALLCKEHGARIVSDEIYEKDEVAINFRNVSGVIGSDKKAISKFIDVLGGLVGVSNIRTIDDYTVTVKDASFAPNNKKYYPDAKIPTKKSPLDKEQQMFLLDFVLKRLDEIERKIDAIANSKAA